MISPDAKAAGLRPAPAFSGFLDDPDAIRSVLAMASFTPAAQPPPGLVALWGGGGSFGGGGAAGSSE